jgi:diacylglycerol kinase (ATP)
MLVHVTAALLVVVLALVLRLTLLEFALLTLAVTLVLFAELVNTAIEVLVDLVSPEYHPLARRIKDVAAGAVLTASVGALVIGYLAISRLLEGSAAGAGESSMSSTGNLSMVAVVVVILLVTVIKARVGRGTPLHGGMPSGHAGVAFSLATSLAFAEISMLFLLLAWLLAALVAQSRVLIGVHDTREVVVGALLGVGVTALLHLIFS